MVLKLSRVSQMDQVELRKVVTEAVVTPNLGSTAAEVVDVSEQS